MKFMATAVLTLLACAGAHAASLVETPFFAKAVADETLPPVEQRVPQVPGVADFSAEGEAPGQPGGILHLLMGSGRDTRMMTVYGYARLVVYDRHFQLKPDILESFEAKDDRIFTLRLRKGHKWSDGKPFTTEDFRYFWEDVANNKEVSPAGVPHEMLVDSHPPTVTILDSQTIRYEWEKPNPTFLAALAGPAPLYLYRPAHYLKQFHQKYAKKEELKAMVEARRVRSWAQLHKRMDAQ